MIGIKNWGIIKTEALQMNNLLLSKISIFSL